MTWKERYAPNIPSIKYLSVPVDEVKISEGFIYSLEERRIHGAFFHHGVDYDVEYGAPVCAAASGLAFSTYHRFSLLSKENKPMGFGLGLFVQIYHSEEESGIKGGRITQYGHLSQTVKNIPFIRPSIIDVDLNKYPKRLVELAEKMPWLKYKFGLPIGDKKEFYMHTNSEVEELFASGSPHLVHVDRGEIIGYAGNSGLPYNAPLPYDEKDVNGSKLDKLQTWDTVHLHFVESARDSSGAKIQDRDPYGIYKTRRNYLKDLGRLKDSLFL